MPRRYSISYDVDTFLDEVKNERRRADARAVVDMMQAVSNESPRLWGASIIGFGVQEFKLSDVDETVLQEMFRTAYHA